MSYSLRRINGSDFALCLDGVILPKQQVLIIESDARKPSVLCVTVKLIMLSKELPVESS